MFSKFLRKNYDKPIVRTVSLSYNFFRTHISNWNKTNRILPGLYLGIIPVKKSYCDFLCGDRYNNKATQILKNISQTDADKPLKLVISVVLPAELRGEGFGPYTMVSQEDWKDEGVAQHILPMPDFGAVVDNQKAIETILRMKECIDRNETVYVHCKAGAGRSAMICAIYLAAFEKHPETKESFSIEQAVVFLQSKRPQVHLDLDKIAKAKEILKEMKELKPKMVVGAKDAKI